MAKKPQRPKVELVPPAAPAVTKKQMQALCREGRQGFKSLVVALIALKYRQGWHLLGYKTFREAMEGEFGRTQQWADEQIWLHEANRRYLPPPTGQTITTAVVELGTGAGRKLRKLETEEDQKAACAEAREMCREGQEAREFSDNVQIVVDRYLKERGEAEAAEGPAPLEDELGNSVADWLRPAFEGRENLKALAKLIRTARQHVNDVRQLCSRCGRKSKPDPECPECHGRGSLAKPGAERLDTNALAKRLSDALHAVVLAIPHSICDACGGKLGGCPACQTFAWVTKAQLQGGPITPNQEKLLKKRGHQTEGMTKAEASRIIDDIAYSEGWRPKPEDLEDF